LNIKSTSAIAMALNFKTLTLNCWGLPDAITRTFTSPARKNSKWIQPKRTDRIKEIGKRIAQFDLVCLQEVWMEEDFQTLVECGKKHELDYSTRFYSGALGASGLAIISRYRIVEAHFWKYRLNGQVLRVDHGDFYAGKGIGYVKIEVMPNVYALVYVTHTIAQYTADNESDHYKADRLAQIWELAHFIRMTSDHVNNGAQSCVLVVGDFNCTPHHLEYKLLRGLLGSQFVESFEEWTRKNLTTAALPKDHWITMENEERRLDYIFYKKSPTWKLTSSEVTMKHEDGRTLISDHYGVSANFLLQLVDSPTVKAAKGSNVIAVEDGLLAECIQVGEAGLKQAVARRQSHLLRAFAAFALLMLCIIVNVSAYIPVSLSGYVMVELLIAIILVNNEVTSLQQFLTELKLYRSVTQ